MAAVLFCAFLLRCSAVPTTESFRKLENPSSSLQSSIPPSSPEQQQIAMDGSTTYSLVSASASAASDAAAAAASAAAGVHTTASDLMTAMHKWMRGPWSKPDDDICTKEDWRKTSLKLVQEMPVAGLFTDLKGTVKWEASGMDVVNGNQVFMVFDSLDYVGYTNIRFEYRNPENKLIGRQSEAESSFEAIMFCHDTKTFLMVRETVPIDSKTDTFCPSVVEARVGTTSYDVLEECVVDYCFDSENKVCRLLCMSMSMTRCIISTRLRPWQLRRQT